MRVLRRARSLVMDLAGQRKAYGFKWYVKGADVSWALQGHEAYLDYEILHQGQHFIDVGAHIGRWSIPASSFFKRVTSIEPMPLTNRLLRTNVALNHIRNIHVIQKAASSRHGPADFWNYDDQDTRSLGANSLFQYHCGLAAKSKLQVELMTLDDLPDADQVKIDVEDAEVDVLRGAERQLSNRPKLIIELHSLKNHEPVRLILGRAGYEKIQRFPMPGPEWLVTLVAE